MHLWAVGVQRIIRRKFPLTLPDNAIIIQPALPRQKLLGQNLAPQLPQESARAGHDGKARMSLAGFLVK